MPLGMTDILNGGKKSICIDLKHTEGIKITQKLITKTDILLEPFRPGEEFCFVYILR